jgi:hypothetical protein
VRKPAHHFRKGFFLYLLCFQQVYARLPQVDLQHPLWGDVSYLRPMPKAAPKPYPPKTDLRGGKNPNTVVSGLPHHLVRIGMQIRPTIPRLVGSELDGDQGMDRKTIRWAKGGSHPREIPKFC